jgi:hypothetical protein
MTRSISIIGWSIILISAIMILAEFFSLFSNPLEQLNTLFRMIPQARSGTESITVLFLFNRFWSVYTILYFLVVLAGAIQFVRFRRMGRTILEIACWIGILNACADSFMSYLFWTNMQAALVSAMGTMGMNSKYLNPIGIITIISGFFLWIIPSFGMVLYLRNLKVKAAMR